MEVPNKKIKTEFELYPDQKFLKGLTCGICELEIYHFGGIKDEKVSIAGKFRCRSFSCCRLKEEHRDEENPEFYYCTQCVADSWFYEQSNCPFSNPLDVGVCVDCLNNVGEDITRPKECFRSFSIDERKKLKRFIIFGSYKSRRTILAEDPEKFWITPDCNFDNPFYKKNLENSN